MNARALKDADKAIRHFEAAGRQVVGIEYTKEGFKLEFAKTEDKVNPIDLVDMSGK